MAALERAFPEADGDLQAHLAECARCKSAWSGWEQLAELGKALPARDLDDGRRQAIRDAIVLRSSTRSAAARGAGTWRTATAAVAAAAVLAVTARLAWMSTQPDPAPAPRVVRGAQVHGHEGARFMPISPPPDEIVRLTEGSITVEVQPLAPGDRFRVVTADAEVEVLGTVFEVEARNDRLGSVYVLRGRVEVRRVGHAPFVLNATERWRSEPTTAAIPEATAGAALVRRPPPPRAEAPHTAPREPRARAMGKDPPDSPHRPTARPEELRYQEGWGALRSGDLTRAAVAFEEVAAADGAGALAAEAVYWRAVALGRAGRSAEAARALADYVKRDPAAPRADEAAAMLGWLLFERGDTAGATRHFTRAARSGVGAAKESATRGLEAIGHGGSP